MFSLFHGCKHHLNQYLKRLTRLFYHWGTLATFKRCPPPSGPGTALCKVSPWGAVSSKLPPPPPGCGSFSTRKQGSYPAPFRRGAWQLIFFCRIHVCNLHFHVGIPLRPVLNPPAVQTGWLIKGILFVKQYLTPRPPHHLLLSLPFSSNICSLFILTHPLFPSLWFSALGLSQELFFGTTTENILWSPCI